MSKKRLYVFIGIACLLMVALVAIQVVWLRNSLAVQKKAHELQVHRALENIQEELSITYNCFEFFSKSYVNPGEGIYIVKQQWDSTGFKGRPDTVDMLYDYEEFRNEEYRSEVPYRFADYQASYPTYAEITIAFRLELEDTGSFLTEQQMAGGMNRENFRQLTYSNKTIDELFDMEAVDSTIGGMLQKNGINRPYGFAFINALNKQPEYIKGINDTALLAGNNNRTQLFRNNRFIKPYDLVVLFPADGFGGMDPFMLTSVLIIILLAGSFIFFIKLYFDQTKLSELKSDFINNLTHEFNTPMANIALALETIDEGNVQTDDRLRHLLNIISTESQRLRDNIERALHVATLEKGSLTLRDELVDMAELVNAVEPTYALQCEQLGGRLNIRKEGICSVRGDETHLLNCICNLLDNAIKYREGAPEIDIVLKEEDKNVVLTIADKGIGMSSATQKYIFDMFYRAHEGNVHNTKGFGLGLNYVKGIIEASGGKIEVWSKEGAGSKFTIYLPKAKQ